MKVFCVILLHLLFVPNYLISQEYRSPVDFKILLSGTFGELRSNHFHAGIDIKTKGVEGQNIYAIEKGYVSRIKVSSYGYGKALYINHPDGRTSVYAHLKKFNSKIEKYIKKEQYKKESFEIDISIQKDILQIEKGDIIALSGNTGSSGGAHLHFEIRETKTQRPINPLSFNMDVKDEIAPIIDQFKIYTEIDKNGTVYDCFKKNEIYIIKDTIEVDGNFAVSVSTYDKANHAYNKNGIYSIKLWADSVLTYHFEVDELDFSTSKHINSHIDYAEKTKNNKKYHRCFRLPFNKLNNYKEIVNDGWIIGKDSIRNIKISIMDYNRNLSVLEFKVKNKIHHNDNYICKEDIFYHNKINIFQKSNDSNYIKIYTPKNSLYSDECFTYNEKDSVEGVYGKIHSCHNELTPLNKKYTMSIKPNVPKEIKNKVYLAKRDKKGNLKNMGGVWKNNIYEARLKEFGDFCIVADTINPIIKGVNIFPGKTFKKQTNIKCIIKDKESGIKSYRGEIDGKWILMEYDFKTNVIHFDIDDSLKSGDHVFTLLVIDNVGNKGFYKAKFTK